MGWVLLGIVMFALVSAGCYWAFLFLVLPVLDMVSDWLGL